MFTQREITGVRKLVNEEISYRDVLDESEIDQVLVNKMLICDNCIVAKSRRSMMLKKVVEDSFDLFSLVEEITKLIKGSFEIRIGLSFIAQTKANQNIYFFAIKARCLNQTTRMIRSKTHRNDLLDFLRPLKYRDLLEMVFDLNNDLHSFIESGYKPKKLVCCSVWLTKFL